MLLLTATAARAADLFVNSAGGAGVYTTVQAAIDAAPSGTAATRTRIFIAPGTYTETAGSNANLNIAKPFVTLIGQGASPSDVVIQNAVTGLTGGVRLQGGANDFIATNLTLQNTLGHARGVAVALRNSADRSAFLNVRIIGFQDTLLVENKSREYFKNCYISGDVDFIFGNATAVFQSCTINSAFGGAVTAAETNPTQAIGMVFKDCTLTAGAGATAGSVKLGRPWHWPASDGGKIASVTYINTRMGPHVNSAGWDPWDGAGNPPSNNTNPDGTTRYAEFNSMDASGAPLPLDANGVPIGRVNWADPMTSAQADAHTLGNIFSGPSYWNANGSLQPEYIGPYTDQNTVTAWDAEASLATLPEPGTAGIVALLAAISLPRGRRHRVGA
jgi:pectinesterase